MTSHYRPQPARASSGLSARNRLNLMASIGHPSLDAYNFPKRPQTQTQLHDHHSLNQFLRSTQPNTTLSPYTHQPKSGIYPNPKL